MQFSNTPLPLELLPKRSALTYTALSQHYFLMKRLLRALSFIVVSVSVITVFKLWLVSLNVWQVFALLVPVALSSVDLWLGHRRDKAKGYSIRQHDISFRSGLFFNKVITQPFTRIQHCELKSNPIERQFGLTVLSIYSAGGGLHTFAIPGLRQGDAERLRETIVDYTRGSHKDINQALEIQDPELADD